MIAAWCSAGVVAAALVLGGAADTAGAQPDEEPSIAIRPFGTATAALIDPVGADPIALALDEAAGKLYWAEQRSGSLRRANVDGSGIETVVADLDGPVAIALGGDGHIYWATDANFPRRIGRARLDGTQLETLVIGEDLNRPRALGIDAAAKRLYWVEAVSGRVRRADLDGSSIENLHEERMLASFGLALHPSAARVYWTDLTQARIQRMPLEGGDVEDVLTASDGLDVPAGLAIAAATKELYWADRGTGSIRRAPLAGIGTGDVVGPEQGVVEPHALALDAAARVIYWTDLTTDEIRRANVDGSDVQTIVRLASGFEKAIVARMPDGATGDAARGLVACRDALTVAGARYARATYKAVTTCLDKMSFVKAVKWRAVEPSYAAMTCARSLPAAASAPSPGSADAGLAAALGAACDPATGAFPRERLFAMVLDETGFACDAGKVKGELPAAWIQCVSQRYAALAFDAIASRYGRAREWLEEARPFVRALTGEAASGVSPRALAALDGVYAQIEKRAARPAVHAAGYPATGLMTSYAADRDDGVEGPVAVSDDGALAAGAPLRFTDNGDGTVTDLNTDLVWEKKCDGCGGPHDSLFGYRWSGDGEQETIWDWLAQVNAEGGNGFAGHSDWRVANVKELVGIVDYERFNPSVSTAFDGALCGLGCSDVKNPECSCTAQGPYWSSTTFSDFPAHAYVVTFNLGLVGDDVKTTRHFVRAVRGPLR